MKQIIINSNINNLNRILSEINESLEPYSIDFKSKFQLELVIEEIFTNICRYSYETESNVEIDYCLMENPLMMKIIFVDEGIEFNPLNEENPDLTSSADEREIGGLGLTLIKKNVDSIEYEYKDQKNILTITKLLKII